LKRLFILFFLTLYLIENNYSQLSTVDSLKSERYFYSIGFNAFYVDSKIKNRKTFFGIFRNEFGFVLNPKIEIGTSFNFAILKSNYFTNNFLQHENGIFLKYKLLKSIDLRSISQICVANSHFEAMEKKQKYFFAFSSGFNLRFQLKGKFKHAINITGMLNFPLKENYYYQVIYIGNQKFRPEMFTGYIIYLK